MTREHGKDDVTIVIEPDPEMVAPTKKLLRNIPVQTSTATVHLPPSPRENGVPEDTELYVLARGMVRLERLDPTVDRVLLGGGPYAEVPMPGSGADTMQIAVVRRPDGWWFMDRGKRDLCTFDGLQTVQYHTAMVSRTVVGMGKAWTIFFGARGASRHPRSHYSPVRAAESTGPHVEVECGDGEVAGTWGEVILIGSHEKADLRPTNGAAAPFHGMLYWTPDGLAYQPLALDLAAVPVEPGRKGERRLRDRGLNLLVRFVGDCGNLARARAKELSTDWSRFLLNPHEPRYPQLSLTRMKQELTLGRGGCDIRLAHSSLSRLHLRIVTGRKSFTVTDCGSSNGTFVNGERLPAQSAREVFAGDELVVGQCRYRVSYGN